MDDELVFEGIREALIEEARSRFESLEEYSWDTRTATDRLAAFDEAMMWIGGLSAKDIGVSQQRVDDAVRHANVIINREWIEWA